MAGVEREGRRPEIKETERGGKPRQRYNLTYNLGHSVWLLGQGREQQEQEGVHAVARQELTGIRTRW